MTKTGDREGRAPAVRASTAGNRGQIAAPVNASFEDAEFTSFDEAEWTCPPPFSAAYAAACARGRESMSGLRVVVCGIARDAEPQLPATIARISRTVAMFADYRVVIYENDSADGTAALLRAWSAGDPKVTAISQSLGNPKWGSVRDLDRMHDLAGYRNQYRRYIVDHFGDFEIVLVVDVDLLGWSYDGLANTFGHSRWDMVGSNGIAHRRGRPIYWDAFAYRAVGHPEAHHYVDANMLMLPRGAPLVPVLSCFGGLAVYRMQAMQAAEYAGGDCEHVVLHKAMQAAGYNRMFLNPSMITRYPDWEAVIPGRVSRPRWWNPRRSG